MAERQNLSTEDNVNVVEDFSYDSRNPQYNHDYRQWRRTAKSPYIYRAALHKKEAVYLDGAGFSKPNVAVIEQQTMQRVSEIVGLGMMVLLICQLLGGSLMIWVLRMAGLDIRLDFLTLSMKGSQWLVVGVRALVLLVEYAAALGVLNSYFRLPQSVRMPMALGNVPETALAFGCAAACAAFYCLVDALTGQGSQMTQMLFSYKDTIAMASYGLFDVLFVSLLSELLLHGLLLPVLRQFGDPFAVWTIAVLAFLCPNELPDRVGAFCVSACAGYLLIRSGSFSTCVLLRIVYAALVYCRLTLVYADTALMRLPFFLLLLLGIALLAGAFYWLMRKPTLGVSNRGSHLPTAKKLTVFAQTITMLPFLAFAALLTLLQLFY